MSRILSYRDLDAWREAMRLAEQCYRMTSGLPKSEQFGLTAQMRRAAVSIPSNIAEGHRRPRQAFLNHVRIALGSLAELETQTELAVRLNFITDASAQECRGGSASVGRLLHGLIRALERPA